MEEYREEQFRQNRLKNCREFRDIVMTIGVVDTAEPDPQTHISNNGIIIDIAKSN